MALSLGLLLAEPTAAIGFWSRLFMSVGETKGLSARSVHYSGRVQGVGFRATVQGLARGRKVVGWVRNLEDGRVELFVQGHPSAVAAFLAEIQRVFARNVTGVSEQKCPPTAGLLGFEVRY